MEPVSGGRSERRRQWSVRDGQKELFQPLFRRSASPLPPKPPPPIPLNANLFFFFWEKKIIIMIGALDTCDLIAHY